MGHKSSNGVPVTIKKKQLSFIEISNPKKNCQLKHSDFFHLLKPIEAPSINDFRISCVDKPIINLT